MVWLCQQRVPTTEEIAARAINGIAQPSIHGHNCLCVTDANGHLYKPIRSGK